MKLVELLEHFAHRLGAEREKAARSSCDGPITTSAGRLLRTVGMLHLYQFDVAGGDTLFEDAPLTVLPPGNLEATEGFVLGRRQQTAWIQTFDAFGQTVASATIVPDSSGFFETAEKRLAEMARKPEKYSLGAGERLMPFMDPDQTGASPSLKDASSGSVLTLNWNEDAVARRAKLAGMAVELVRANKRLLVISPDHASSDAIAGALARALRGAGLQFKSLLSRYELSLATEMGGIQLHNLGFEAQMHQFYAKSRNEKATLRRKYERFRELTPILAYKSEKQRDLNEVKLLEWRLLTQLSDLQGKIKGVDETLARYEQIPLWKRVAMQASGKNVTSLQEYRVLYDEQVKDTLKELDIAKIRIDEIRPEAAIPKDMRPEYSELKEEVFRLGGTKKIRELLAAEEGTNRQAFIQTKRVVVTTASRVVTDPLFDRVRFDVLLVDEAPRTPSPYLLAAAGLVRERVVVSGDQREIPSAVEWASSDRITGCAPSAQ